MRILPREGQSSCFLFDRSEPEVIVGQISLNNILGGAAHYCDLGCSLAEAKQGQGLMTEAVGAVICYAFDELRPHRVKAAYLLSNERSGLLRRLGFLVEGFARDYLLIRGRWQDQILVGLTNPDWRKS